MGLCSDELRKLDDEVIALRVPGRRLHMVVPVVCEPPRDIVLLVELLERGQMNFDIELGPNQVHSLLQRAASPLFKCRCLCQILSDFRSYLVRRFPVEFACQLD